MFREYQDMEPLDETGWCGPAVVKELCQRLEIKGFEKQKDLFSILKSDEEGTRPENIENFFNENHCQAFWQQPEDDSVEAAVIFLQQLQELKYDGCEIILDCVIFYANDDLHRRFDIPYRYDAGHYYIYEGLEETNDGTMVVVNDPSSVDGYRGIRRIPIYEFITDWEDWYPFTYKHLHHRALIVAPEEIESQIM